MNIAACQMPYLAEEPEQALNLMINYAKQAEARASQLVCFPECYLQGYIVNEKTAELAIDLSSKTFQDILATFANIKPIVIFGLIERENTNIFNTAAVIKEGQLLGRYRKNKLVGTENNFFRAGNEFPIFELDGYKFGINICYDLNFSECTEAIAKQGAHLLVCPSNNMMRKKNAELWKDKHNKIRSERTKESNIWLVSADVTGETQKRISYGPTAFINPQGQVVKQVPLLKEGIIINKITF